MATDLQKLIQVAAQAGMLPGVQFKDGFPSGTPDYVASVGGQYGLFNVPGLEQELISVYLQGRGLATRLPAFPTNILWPEFGYITGFQDVPDDTGADGPCDDPPTVGHMLGCIQTAHFGLYSYRTREYNIKRAGEQVNRADPNDLVVINNPLLNRLAPITPNVPGNGLAKREFLSRMMELGVAFQRKLSRQIYTADPANATNGGYDEFPGLDILISTGHIDAKTGDTCEALDSLIADMAYSTVMDTTADGYGNDQNVLFATMVGILHYLENVAQQSALDPVTWGLAMKPDLFYELTAIWPCIYQTFRCNFVDSSGNNRAVVDAGDMIRMRDDMRRGNYLQLDGQNHEVITDPFIPSEHHGDVSDIPVGCEASDIYGVPLTYAGGNPGTYWQYFDYQATNGAMDAAADWRVAQYFWTDGGRFLWETQPPINGCVIAEATIRPRVLLRVPQLAFKIQNVTYCPQRAARGVLPTDDNYLAGGVASRTADEPFSTWNPVPD